MNEYTWDEFYEQIYTARGWHFNPSTLYQKVVTNGKLDIIIQDTAGRPTEKKITIRRNPCRNDEEIKNSSIELNAFLADFVTQGVMI